MPGRPLRRGDIVEVCRASEIHATHDARGMLDGLPFMPEMLPMCGQRSVVERRAEQIGDTMYSSGNVGLLRFLKVVARAVVHEPLRRLRLRGAFPLHGPHAEPPVRTHLGLQPGDVVTVKSREEIARSLTREGVNAGVWFDDEN